MSQKENSVNLSLVTLELFHQNIFKAMFFHAHIVPRRERYIYILGECQVIC